MLFNSWQFLVFLALVLACYHLLRRRWVHQNHLLLLASYIFYGAWDWRFCGLLLASTLLDYVVGRKLAASTRHKRGWLAVSLGFNLGLLGLFKYFDFFVDSAAGLLAGLGLQANALTLELILPVGISFYTFQTISYTVDVYRGSREPVGSLRAFALYVAFFPQLVAGPIERSTQLLPQLQRPRTVRREDWRVGLWWVLLGYFKKVVLADTLAPFVEAAFRAEAQVSGTVLVLAVVAFAVQVYGDFAGYSLIARGVARWMGIGLMRNFRAPYLARSPRDIWRRWHISLSSWLREYLYYGLGGSRGGRVATLRNLLVTMVLGGLWHGAGWNFVLWGGFHGVVLVVEHVLTGNRPPQPGRAWLTPWKIAGSFLVMAVGYFIFLSTGLEHLGGMMAAVVGSQAWTPEAAALLWPTVAGFGLLLGYQLMEERTGNDVFMLGWPWWGRLGLGSFLVSTILAVGFRPQPFFYFQF